MKNTFISTAMMAILITCLLSIGCKKYEDGPGLSLRSKKERLTGKWEVVSLTENGNDVLFYSESDVMTCKSGSSVYYTETESYKPYYFEFIKDGTFKELMTYTGTWLDYSQSFNACKAIYESETMKEEVRGKWDFSNDMEYVIVNYDDIGYTIKFKILELRDSNIKLEMKDGMEYYLYTLEKR